MRTHPTALPFCPHSETSWSPNERGGVVSTVMDTATAQILRMPNIIPEAKLFLVALAETGDAGQAEDMLGLPLQPAVAEWLRAVGLVTANDDVDLHKVSEYITERS